MVYTLKRLRTALEHALGRDVVTASDNVFGGRFLVVQCDLAARHIFVNQQLVVHGSDDAGDIAVIREAIYDLEYGHLNFDPE